MGQKINPTGFRLPVTRNWTSRWYAVGRNFSRTLGEDLRVRAFLEKHPEFVPETDAGYLPEPLRCRCENGMAQFLSHRDHVEGFFIARMRRKGV